MIYENDWLTTNVLDFKKDKNIEEVKCEFVPGDFEESSFMDAATKVANTIKNKYEHIYVAYSGGSDTTFIVNTLHSVGAKFTPIAIEAEHTTDELERAGANCARLGLDLVVLDFMGKEKAKDLRRLYKHYIMDNFINGNLPTVRTPVSIFFFLIIHDYIKKIHPDAILINGHRLGGSTLRSDVSGMPAVMSFHRGRANVWSHSWDLFPSLWEKESASMITFLMYNQHIMYETTSHMNKLNLPPYWDNEDNVNDTEASFRDLRCDMYNIPRESKVKGWKKMDKEWKKFYMNKENWINAGKLPPKFRKKDSDSNYRTYAQIWRSLKS
jgi:hypothetical protein